MVELGYNYRLTDIGAALGSGPARAPRGVPRPPSAARGRATSSGWPSHRRSSCRPSRPGPTRPGTSCSSSSGSTGCGSTAAAVYHALRAEGIGVNVHYIPVHRHPFYRGALPGPVASPVAEAAYERLLTLPLFAGDDRRRSRRRGRSPRQGLPGVRGLGPERATAARPRYSAGAMRSQASGVPRAMSRAARRPRTASYSRVCIPAAGRIERTFRAVNGSPARDVLDDEQRAPEAAALVLFRCRPEDGPCPMRLLGGPDRVDHRRELGRGRARTLRPVSRPPCDTRHVLLDDAWPRARPPPTGDRHARVWSERPIGTPQRSAIIGIARRFTVSGGDG